MSSKTRSSKEGSTVADLFSLSGRVAVVTGGCGRYGRPISTALAQAGATVIVASRDLEHCLEFANELRSRNLQAHAQQMDLSSVGSVGDGWRQIEDRWHHIDVLVNNAVARSGTHFETISEEDWYKTLSVNAIGLFVISKLAAGHMTSRRSGSIINIASIHGVVAPDFDIYGSTGWTSPANYAFEKGGMVQFTRYLAALLGPHSVRVNALSPGGLYAESMPDEFLENYCRRAPLGRLASPIDIMGAAVFLASDASAYVTGHNLVVDGGYTAL